MTTAAEELEAKRQAAIADELAKTGGVDIERIYRRGLTVADIGSLPPDTYLVSPLKPSGSSSGGIVLSHHIDDLPGTAAIAFRIEARADDLVYHVGDVVLVRNAMLEPLDPGMGLLLIASRHVIAKLKASDARG